PSVLLDRTAALLANPDAVDAAVDIGAYRAGADCGARDWTRPQHDAGPYDAIGRVSDIGAVDHRARGCAAEGDAGQSQQGTHRNTCNGRRLDEMTILPHGVLPSIVGEVAR